MSLRKALRDPNRFVFLYGTTPPRADAGAERIERAATRLAERTRGLTLDGLVVYDVQDEQDRTDQPRPYPFLPTLDSRVYARTLQEATGRPVIAYKCIAQMAERDWAGWLDETVTEYDIGYLSFVGRASSKQASGGLSLSRAMQTAAAHAGDLTLGGVVIPERHRPDNSESLRLRRKADAGCEYFISQAVYDPEPTIRLLHDYADDCRAQGIAPKRIILTFTPCGRPETLSFMKWLGISVPAETERTLLSASDPLTQSIAICTQNLRRLQEADRGHGVPLGVSVESVSIRKEEIAASVDLAHALRDAVTSGGAGR